jgi:hypothetical protein
MPQYDSSVYPLITDPQPDDRVLIWRDSSGSNVRVSVEDLVTSANVGVTPVANGGTGQSSFTDGQILVGNSVNGSLNKTTITAGTNVTITNGHGAITISSSAVSASLPSTGPLYSTLIKDIAGSLSSAADCVWRSPDVFNVKDYGAVGNDISTVVGAQGYLVAGTFIAGNHYIVKNTGGGSTDFTLIGAANNTPGTEFVATGVGTGTGQAYVDDSFAFQAAIDAACLNTLGVVYVPAGLWGVRNLIVPAANNPTIAIIGDGPNHSRLQNFLVGNSTNPILSWFPGGGSLRSPGFIEGISIQNYGNRSPSSPLLLVSSAEKIVANNLTVFGMYDCVKFSLSNLIGENVFIFSGTTDNDYSGCCLMMMNGSARLGNSTLKTTSLMGTAAPGLAVGKNLAYSPPLWLNGTATGHVFTNVSVTGAGAKYSITPSSVVLSANVCTVNGLTGHLFNVNDYIVLTGMTPSYLNGYFRVTTLAGSSVSFANVNTNVTASVIGLATSVPCAVLVENISGAQNESTWIGGLIEAAGYPLAPLSAGFYFDGRSGGAAGSGHAISGWNISGAYIDIGRVSVLITGGGTDGTCLTTNRINVSNIIAAGNGGDSTSSALGAVWVEQTPGVSINGLVGFPSLVDATAKAVYAYADSNPAHQGCHGLSVCGSVVGAPAAYNYATSPLTVCKYGIVLDGAIKGASITGNTIAGFTSPVLNTNSAVANSTILNCKGNTFISGSVDPVVGSVIPTVASAATITLPFNDVIKISGTTTINTINGGWIGRTVKLLFINNPSLTGGNINTTITPGAGTSLSLICDGTVWWVA